jgi:hypothetical protein
MTRKRPTTSSTGGKRKPQRPRVDTSTPSVVSPADQERRLVDVDPWAMLLEQLVEAPEPSAPAERGEGENPGPAEAASPVSRASRSSAASGTARPRSGTGRRP